MDYPSSQKQITLTQHSMSGMCDIKCCDKEEIPNKCNYASVICSVQAAIESHPGVFKWNRQSHNFDMTEETQRRNREIITLDKYDSDNNFLPKPQCCYAKPTFTPHTHTPNRSI